MIKCARALLTVVATVSLALGGALAANAGTQDDKKTTFDSIIPAGQQSHYMPSQNKEKSGCSLIYFEFIGADYSMNVKAQNRQNGQQYEEQIGLGEDSVYVIPNGTPVNKSSRLIVTTSEWTQVRVVARGWYYIR